MGGGVGGESFIFPSLTDSSANDYNHGWFLLVQRQEIQSRRSGGKPLEFTFCISIKVSASPPPPSPPTCLDFHLSISGVAVAIF